MSTRRRNTAQRALIEAALVEAKDFVSAQDLHARLRADGNPVGLATVYRNLNDLVSSGAADTIQMNGTEQLFRHCGDEHHHHLVCVDCGRTIEIAEHDDWVESVARRKRFTLISHTIEIFGRCPDCRRQLKTEPS
ncbi:Fur family transcriptional regulator [Microlunatus soli]|uniref:Zinc uptake regulator, Fur family n=1 Tax=Microlunatus soli TaxID=630515 RepID=A0A1H1MXQ1_9ACTN|nr:Fur family transcriptional regulator [Microlunatus soli]SDR91407.1 zinc uptake regulator, Fur family [Microlunatus soli]